MKIIKNSIIYLCVSACLLLSSQVVYGGIAGYAQFVRGNVQLTSMTGQTSILKKGAAVNEGDTVITERGANAQIKMQDGGFVAVRPDTQLKFDSFKFSGKEDGNENLVFSLVKGGFRSVTGLIGRINKPKYRITTAAATIGIRGTDHETFVVLPESLLANTAPAGTYNKVNVGETFIATNVGTIFVLPNQMGYAGNADQMPELRPINTDLFTVAEKPTKDAKSDEEEESEEVRETADVDSTAEESTAPETDVAAYTLKDINLTILQAILDNNGTDLTGGNSVPIIVAAYDPKNILIGVSPPYMSWNAMAAPGNVIYDANGGLLSFIDSGIAGNWSESYSVIGATTAVTGTATSGTTGIQFGRWLSASAIESSITHSLETGATWMYGAQGYLDAGITTANGQMYGTFSYVLDGNTAPHDTITGQSGVLTNASISVDFINSLFSANLALTMGNQNWAASATNVTFSAASAQFSAYATPGGTFNTMTISTGATGGTLTLCSTCGGNMQAGFTGQNYAGAILAYNFYDTAQGGYITGEAAFARTGLAVTGGAITNLAPAPTGRFFVATQSGLQTVDILSATSGVLTAYGWGSLAQGSYGSASVNCTGTMGCTGTAATNATTAGASTGIYYGSWDGANITQTFGTSTGSSSPMWITGPESGPLFLANALIGTKIFNFDGGMVANALGVPGTVLGTTTLTVDFTRQVIGVNIDLSVPDTQLTPVVHTWNATTLPGNEAIISGGSGIGGATFYTSSYNPTAAGLLTVTVDNVTSGNGYVSGQLTGSGLNGAILNYSLDAMLPTTYEQINGVAALVGTTSDVATPHRAVMVSLTDPNPASISSTSILGMYQNSDTRVLADSAGNLTRFDMSQINGSNNDGSVTLTSGTSVLANTGSDPLTGISWGRWAAGAINVTNRSTAVTTPNTLVGSLHWIAGPTETSAVTLPVSGTYTYINSGGTAPTDNLGNVGTLNNASLSADFTAQTVNVGVNVTIAGSTLNAAAANVPILQNSVFYATSSMQLSSPLHLAVTCTGTCGTTQGEIVGGFGGAGAIGAMMTYGLQNISATGTQTISGVTAFHR